MSRCVSRSTWRCLTSEGTLLLLTCLIGAWCSLQARKIQLEPAPRVTALQPLSCPIWHTFNVANHLNWLHKCNASLQPLTFYIAWNPSEPPLQVHKCLRKSTRNQQSLPMRPTKKRHPKVFCSGWLTNCWTQNHLVPPTTTPSHNVSFATAHQEVLAVAGHAT